MFNDQYEVTFEQLTAAHNHASPVYQEIHRFIREHPLVQRYTHELSLDPNTFHARSPWQAQAERMGAAIMVGDWMLTKGSTDEEAMLMLHQMLSAEVFLWTNEMCDVADNAPALPPHTISPKILMNPNMYWAFETEYITEYGAIDWLWFLDIPSDNKFLVSCLVHNLSHGTVAINVTSIEYNAHYPEQLPVEAIEVILKRLAFINSPYVSVYKPHHPRYIRRESIKYHNSILSDTSVIVLRRAHQSTPKNNSHLTTRQYSHKWWVSAHYRKQYYPSEDAHHLIWIPSYIKGNPDAPLLTHTYVVKR